MQVPNVDLDLALAFVVERISEEAERSAAPLDDDEKDFLNHLPTEPTNPMASSGFDTAYEGSWPIPVLRDFGFERLCNLARDAHLHDLQTGPDATREWKFAAAVLELHHHPMSWLLGWAGVRTSRRPARWDRLFLLATAVFVVVLLLFGAFVLSFLTDGQGRVWQWTLWIVGACIYGSLITVLYFAVRGLEARQRERYIETCRCYLPVRGSTGTLLKQR